MDETLGDALPRQIERVTAKRDRWIQIAAENPQMGGSMNFAIALMQKEIMAGLRAAASGSVVEMMAAHEALAAYGDDD